MSIKHNTSVLREKMPVRLGPTPKASSKNVSKSMKGNIAKNTLPEVLLRKALFANGIKGYRLNWKKIPGRPDIIFGIQKIAIFVNGCFWHRCPYCKLSLPKSNRLFWNNKFKRNKERDLLKKHRLKKFGWKVITIWECQIKRKSSVVVQKISNILSLSR